MMDTDSLDCTSVRQGKSARSGAQPSLSPPDDVDAVPALSRLLPLSLQHVLIMYAGAVTVPIVVGRALGLDAASLTQLVCADLVACGIATLIQTLGLPGVGIRLPIMMGVTFASVSPMLALIGTGLAAGRAPGAILTTIYGAVIVSGVFGMIIAPLVGRLSRWFPPHVTGCVILMIGLSLMRVSINWAGGGRPDSPEFGALTGLGLALATLLAILALTRLGSGLVRSAAVLLGVVAGSAVAMTVGKLDLTDVAAAPWFAVVRPFQFGMPTFQFPMIAAMCLVMTIVMVESFGMFLAAGEIVGRPADARALTRGLRADALGTIIGGTFNTFAYTSYAQNVGLLTLTGVRSRFVVAGAGVILILLGLCPKFAAVAAAIPVEVLGGAGLVMFGTIAATGIRVIASEELTQPRLLVVAVSIAIGLIPVLSNTFFQAMPEALGPLFHSGIVLTTLAAVLLNLAFDAQSTR
ncbi:nucleobase:cation symporter-2 family protein [Novosphingobium album (ex Hu et al. 2023)]|uniref:Purine permease n=1 Tax=Novosphingobium album (ex Hu et al. 2023) TaxID=2930093 RepID=A0ABT0B3R5_9SPHN|nr:nucleobase:cation symporter-2 family protein [Novosphingobium album (ex Hu et al. 2023)]MCJ2179678.1 purine permease [Novosphingobium album (ex Hu et al. 2023)]